MESTQETFGFAIPTEQSKPQGNCLTVEEIEKRMERDGFPEMRWLWKRFIKSGSSLSGLDDAAIEHSRTRHMGLLISSRTGAVVISLILGTFMYLNHGDLLYPGKPTLFDLLIKVLFSVLSVYLFWFVATGFHRTFIHSWKTISASDLAAMLRRPNYREWFDATHDSRAVLDRLR